MSANTRNGTSQSGETFDNRAFWDQRYQENPALGSGIGSRGENAHNKRAIITRFLDAIRPETILDVGCGDHEVFSCINCPARYHGVDISSTVIDINRGRYPSRHFTCIDFSTLDDVTDYASDAVISFEVLIHQHARREYENLLQNIVRATRYAALISAYQTNPLLSLRSAIIAWHEPITTSLERLGARDINIYGRSLESEHLVFVSFRR